MKKLKLDTLKNEGLDTVRAQERRQFLKFGLSITGVFLGGSLLSLTSTKKAHAVLRNDKVAFGPFPYNPHYTMIIRQGQCVDCERCLEACRSTNGVPAYGSRTSILERRITDAAGQQSRVFMPVLCNQCNKPSCVRVCPTGATYKDTINGIVRMQPNKCIGCKTCMAACPYNARYYKEEARAIDKCTFCFDTKLQESGGKITACCAACPAAARVFGDLTNPKTEAYQLIHTPGNVFWVLRPEAGTLPNIFYMDAPDALDA
jgi:Fe-S-cluster-containing dehydrogenase component